MTESERLIEVLKEQAAKRTPEERAANVSRFKLDIARIDRKIAELARMEGKPND
jgi:hypothetical protein